MQNRSASDESRQQAKDGTLWRAQWGYYGVNGNIFGDCGCSTLLAMIYRVLFLFFSFPEFLVVRS